jgi:hypothetical protein
MCAFVSWIKYKDEVYFLVNEYLETKEGKKLLSKDIELKNGGKYDE